MMWCSICTISRCVRPQLEQYLLGYHEQRGARQLQSCSSRPFQLSAHLLTLLVGACAVVGHKLHTIGFV